MKRSPGSGDHNNPAVCSWRAKSDVITDPSSQAPSEVFEVPLRPPIIVTFYLTASSSESVFYWSMAPVTGYLGWYLDGDRTQKSRKYRWWLAAVPEAQNVQIRRDPLTSFASYLSMAHTTHALTRPRPRRSADDSGMLALVRTILLATGRLEPPTQAASATWTTTN